MSQIAQSILAENPDINIYDAFISYGRKESKSFAKKLYDSLDNEGFKVWFDQNDIPLGVDFQNQIDEGINRAQNFIFIISPHSLKSIYCLKEVVLALKRGKRIIPILHVEPEEQEVWDKMHPELSKINWLYMREDYKLGANLDQLAEIDPFNTGFDQLLELMRRHADYVWQHTYFLMRALDWDRGNQQTDLLLVGKDRIHAESWLKIKFKKEQPPCEPIPFHCDYICESTKNSNNLMTEVFISYATENEEEMQQVAATLKRNSITIWTNRTDIQTGSAFQGEINKGIEEADNFLFMISPQSIESKYCQMELEHAMKYNKRIISILVHPTNLELLPAKLQQLQFIDYTTSWGEGDDIKQNYLEDTRKLFRELKEEAHYYRQHKMLLSKALKWERQNNNTSILLRGYDLQNAEAWLKLSKTHKEHPALSLHEAFIQASIDQPKDLSVEAFISYSRADADFARRLNDALQLQGKTTWFDQESIASGADFQQEINNGIENSDNFVFVISPNSISSPYCADEVEYALSFNKRIITILYDPVDPKTLHSGLAAVQWIDFNLNEGDFSANFSELIRTLDNDRDHVHAHTKWAIRAAAWEDKDKDKSLLLRGSEFALAEDWFNTAQETNKSPRPTAIQEEYIAGSKAAIIAEEQKEQRTIRRLRILLFVAFMALCGAGYATWKAYHAKVRIVELLKKSHDMRATALKQKKEAEELQKVAESQRDLLEAKEDSLKQAVELAILNEQKAKESSIVATRSKKRALEALGIADIATKEAIEEARLSKNAALLLAKSNTDPTVTFRMLEKLTKDRKNTNATTQKDKSAILAYIDRSVIQSGHSFFYGNRLLHTNWVKESMFSDEGIMMTCDFNKIYLRDKNGVVIKEFDPLHKDYIFDAELSKDGQYLLSAGYDEQAILWNNKGEALLTVGADETDAKTKFTAVAIADDHKKFAVGDEFGIVRIWDFEGNQLAKVEMETSDLSSNTSSYILEMKFSPDGKMLAYVGQNKIARLLAFNDSTKTVSRNIKLEGHQSDVLAVDFSPKGDKLLTGGWGKTLFVWDTKGNQLKKIQTEQPISEAVYLNNDQQIALSTFNQVSNTANIQFWDGEGKLLRNIPAHDGRIRGLTFHHNSQSIISSSEDQYVKIWDIKQLGFPTKVFSDARNALVRGMAISSKDTVIITTGDDSTARIVNFDGTLKRILKHDSKYVMTAKVTNRGVLTATYGGKVFLWSIKGVLLKEMTPGIDGNIWDIDLSKDQMTVLIATSEGEIKMFDWSGTERTGFEGLQLDDNVVSVAFSPTGRYVLGGGYSNRLLCWDVIRRKKYFVFDYEKSITKVSFSPDGKYCAAVVGKEVVLIDILKKEEVKFLERQVNISSMAFSADSKRMIIADENLKHSYWDIETGILKREVDGQKNYSVAIQQNPDNKDIYFVDEAGNIMVMNQSNIDYDSKSNAHQFSLIELLMEGLDISFEEILANAHSVDDLFLAADTYWNLSLDEDKYDMATRVDFVDKSIFLLEKANLKDAQVVKEVGDLANKYIYLAWYSMLNKEYQRANDAAKKGIDYDQQQEYLKLYSYLSLSTLYLGNLDQAIAISKKWKGTSIEENLPFLDHVFARINDYFIPKGITHKDIPAFKLALLEPIQLLEQGAISFEEIYSNNDKKQLKEAARYYGTQIGATEQDDFSAKIILTNRRIKLLEKITEIDPIEVNPATLAISYDQLAWFQLNDLKQVDCQKTLSVLDEKYPDVKGGVALTHFFYNVLYGDFAQVKKDYQVTLDEYGKDKLLTEIALLEKMGSSQENLYGLKLMTLSITELLEQGVVDYDYCMKLDDVDRLYDAALFYEGLSREAEAFSESEKKQHDANALFLQGYALNPQHSNIAERLSGGLGWEGWYQVYNEKYRQAVKSCEQALKYDEGTKWLYSVKTIAQLYHGEYASVQKDIEDWKGQPFVEGESFEAQFLRYLDVFIDYGLYHDDIPKVKRSLLSFMDLLEEGYLTIEEIPTDTKGEELLEGAVLYKERGDNEEGIYAKADWYKKSKILFEMAAGKGVHNDETRAMALWNYSYYGLFNEEEYTEPRLAAEEAIKVFEKSNQKLTADQVGIYTNLALGLLLEGDFKRAKEVYETWMLKPYGDDVFATAFWTDIDALIDEGHVVPNEEQIKTLLAPTLVKKGNKDNFYTYGYYFEDLSYTKEDRKEIIRILDMALKFYLPYNQVYASDDVALAIGNVYWNHAWYSLEASNPDQALQSTEKGIAVYKEIYGESLQDGNGIITCLAPALLLTGKEKEAMEVYKKWKNEAYGYDGETLKDVFLADLEVLKKRYPKQIVAWEKVEVELERE